MPNILFLPIIAVIAFCMGFVIISIPGIRNMLKKDDKRFSDEEMSQVIRRQCPDFASSNEDYSRVQVPLK